ncbi:MAG: hypothetical protein R3223_11550, partial [Longimicrobiales bacterium]|nr:hypothetical protein [Longimicrobiales bacterium]
KKGTVEPMIEEGTKLTKEILDDIDFAKLDLETLKIQNKEVNEKVRRVIDEAASRIERVRTRAEEQIDKVFQPDELPPGVVQLVKVYLAEKRKIAVGDKMAGRHGNKGIIARIAPEEDMPFLPDGSPVELVLNPLGVPSRMNVGQVLETHLGWAADILGFEAKTPVFQGATEDEIGLLLKVAALKWTRDALDLEAEFPEIGVEEINLLVSAAQEILPDTGELKIASGGNGSGNGKDPLKAGLGRTMDQYVAETLPRETRSLFDGFAKFVVEAGKELAERAGEELEDFLPKVAELSERSSSKDPGLDVAAVEVMSRAEIYPNGKIWLRDGRSGRKFDFPVTVGQIYMLKLSHLVDDKIHARSIGPYSLVTQQPLAGKAQFGGQRFGEMEVWALEAYGAAHTLQEILTVKSDDVSGRSRVYEAIVKGDNLPDPGTPESFNVLVKELQSLGLSVTLGHED